MSDTNEQQYTQGNFDAKVAKNVLAVGRYKADTSSKHVKHVLAMPKHSWNKYKWAVDPTEWKTCPPQLIIHLEDKGLIKNISSSQKS